MRFSWPRRQGDSSEEADAVLDHHYDLPSSPGTASTGPAATPTNLRCNRSIMTVDPIDLISATDGDAYEDDDEDYDNKSDSSEDEFDLHRQLLTDVSYLTI